MIVESDGVLVGQQTAWHAAHVAAAQAVGWSSLDLGTFWRLIRTKGRQADLLPAAKPGKVADYWARFDQLIESDEFVKRLTIHDDVVEPLRGLRRHGQVQAVTLGSNLAVRRSLLEAAGIGPLIGAFEKLDPDPRRRPVEIKHLVRAEPRRLLVAASDALIRSAGAAEILCVGIPGGTCTESRLHQAGAGVVYKELNELRASLDAGAADLIRAGLLPRSLDAPRL